MFTRTVLNSSQVQGWGISLASWPVYLCFSSPYSFMHVIPVVRGYLVMLHLGKLSFFILSIFMVLGKRNLQWLDLFLSWGEEAIVYASCWVLQGKLILVQRGYPMAQAVRHQSLAAELQVQSQISPCMICGGWSGTITDSSPSTSVFPSLLQCFIRIHSSVMDTVRSLQFQQH
jgi:hypothetical protein